MAGILGSLAGAFINYYLAKFLGVKFINKYGKYFLLPPDKFEKIQKFFKTHGSISTFTARLIPGVRQYISVPAGLSDMDIKKFTFYTGLGSGIWMVTLVLVGMAFGHNEELIKEHMSSIMKFLFIAILILVIGYIVIHKKRLAK